MLADEAPKVRLEVTAKVRAECPATVLQGSALADLETAYRARGLDIAHCNDMRGLAVEIHDLQNSLQAQMDALRERRQSRTCRWVGLFC